MNLFAGDEMGLPVKLLAKPSEVAAKEHMKENKMATAATGIIVSLYAYRACALQDTATYLSRTGAALLLVR